MFNGGKKEKRRPKGRRVSDIVKEKMLKTQAVSSFYKE